VTIVLVIDDEVKRLAGEVVAGNGRRVVAACTGDPELARAVSRAAATRLVERAASHRSAVDPTLFVWPVAQDGVAALAALPGADAQALAGALLRCCVFEAVSGEPDRLEDAALRLILDHYAEVVEKLFRIEPYELHSNSLSPPWPISTSGSTHFLVDAMWTLHGAEGAHWMDLLLDHNPHGIVSSRPRAWTPEDWTLRLDALSDRDEVPEEAYRLAFRMIDPDDPAPRDAAPAVARYACSRFTAGQSPRRYVGRAADVLAPYRSGDAELDAALFWWGATSDDELTALRWLLELSGPAGARPPLVAVALARGLVDAEVARMLAAELDRPLWADRDVPWIVTEVREEGERDVPGDVAALLGSGCLPTRTVVAVHPVHGRADAAVEVLADADAQPLRWEAAGDGLWVGRREDRRTARVIRDLGVLGLDLAAEPPPWFVHDRVAPADEDTTQLPAAIDAEHLTALAVAGAPLRHQRRALREALHQRGVGEYASAVVLRHVRDGIALVATDAPVRSRLGGPGRLPVETPWPALDEGRWYLPLLAELALAELPALEPLPSDGTLLIFQETETWSCEHDPLVGTRVLYVPESDQLHDPPPPPGDVLFPIKEKALRGIAVPIPGESELVVGALEFVDDRDRTIEVMNDLLERWWPEHWLLGASQDVQGPSRLEVGYWLERAPVETHARFTPDELAGQGWTLLAQINEDADAEIGIGDGGSFYLYVLEADLRNRRFDRVVGLMQCH
jgi:hypothetical protein